ncbi:hypothetical protein ACFLZY_03600, partial [Patescibacteria group bacterium]
MMYLYLIMAGITFVTGNFLVFTKRKEREPQLTTYRFIWHQVVLAVRHPIAFSSVIWGTVFFWPIILIMLMTEAERSLFDLSQITIDRADQKQRSEFKQANGMSWRICSEKQSVDYANWLNQLRQSEISSAENVRRDSER